MFDSQGQSGSRKTGSRRRLVLALGLAAAILLIPALALAHIERASYWPKVDVDTADGVPTGGQVPDARPLFTALTRGAGETRVICQQLPGILPAGGPQSAPAPATGKKKGKKKKKKKKKNRRTGPRFTLTQAQQDALASNPSIQRLDQSIANARGNGYVVRPSEGPVFETVQGEPLSGAQWQAYLDQLRNFNLELLAQCQYTSIQKAVNDSGNNDRVVVLPGIYTEPESRAVPEQPAAADNPCDGMEETNDRGQVTALSYRYQFHCPNQQNLIAIMGRAPKLNSDRSEFVPPPPSPTDPRRDGIPDDGPCVRCNLQLEGSGISPDDVVVDSGRVESGNGAPMESQKDVGIRADRADGFVLRNMTVRHSEEHDIYSPETDGLRLERFKTYYNGEYGVLTFVAQNHLIQDCDAAGSGDAAIYPGSSGERGEQTDPDFDADDPMVPHSVSDDYSTEIRRCDMHHSSTGYSGTASSSVWFHHNDMYDNAMGFVTDVFTAAGHPGFPQDSDLIENNEFYSNNFNPFEPGSDVAPAIPAPVGTGMFLPGVNNNTVRNNRFWDNWRRGIMLFAVPDGFVCGASTTDPGTGHMNEQHGCDQDEVNTSHRNEFYGNVMGQAPDGTAAPNGDGDPTAMRTDFWWDEFSGNLRNCWYDNVGPDGTRGSLTATPPLNPGGDTAPTVAHTLPGKGVSGDCSESVGGGSTAQEAELLNCLGDLSFGTGTCDWFTTPPEP